MTSVPPSTASWRGQGGGVKIIHKFSQGQKEGLRQDERSQELDALLLSAEWRGHKYGLHQYIYWSQLVSMGTSLCFTYSWVNPLVSVKGKFHGRPQHRVDVSQLYAKKWIQVVLWGGCHQYEDRIEIGKAHEWRLGILGAEDNWAYIITVLCMSGSDTG